MFCPIANTSHKLAVLHRTESHLVSDRIFVAPSGSGRLPGHYNSVSDWTTAHPDFPVSTQLTSRTEIIPPPGLTLAASGGRCLGRVWVGVRRVATPLVPRRRRRAELAPREDGDPRRAVIGVGERGFHVCYLNSYSRRRVPASTVGEVRKVEGRVGIQKTMPWIRRRSTPSHRAVRRQ
jgi:hypothetical protein